MDRERAMPFIVGGGLVLVVAAFVWFGSRSSVPVVATIPDPSALAGLNTGDAPWPAELDHLAERLTAIGLPALSAEGTVLHIHQHLDIFIDGKEVPVAAGAGIQEAQGFISPIHVHDTSNIVHVESPTVQTFTLGQFFDIWGVRLTANCIGGYCVTGDKTLSLYVDGKPYSGDPRMLALESHQEIAIIYGTPAEMPNPIPSSFNFPEGY